MRRHHLKRFALTLIWLSGILIVGSFVAKEGFAYQGDIRFVPVFFAIGLIGLIIILIMSLV